MKRQKEIIALLVIVALLFFLITYALSIGVFYVSYQQTMDTLIDIFKGNADNSIVSDLIHYLRLPRFALALLIGSGLAVSGCVMQAVLRNPLADPYLLGISSGAGLGAVIAIALGTTTFLGFDCVGLFAFSGAMAVTIFILIISIRFAKKNTLAILLTGIACNAVCVAIISFIMIIYADAEGIQNITFWLMGSLLNNDWENIKYLALLVIPVSVFFCTRYRILNLMLLGDEAALTLGHNLMLARNLYILLCAVLVSAIVYNAGIIGFVGLIIPHITRLLTGNNHLRLLPLSALLGAVFLTWADAMSKIIVVGSEIPIGIIVSLFGTPIFIYLLLNKKYGYGKKYE